MEDFNAFRDIPLWGAFIVLLGILVRQAVPWRQLTLGAEQQIRKELHEHIDKLKAENVEVIGRLITCEKECADHKVKTANEINGLKKQHLQEQLSLVKTIIDIFPDAPQLQLLLRTLESGRRSIKYVGGPIEDGDK